MTLDKDKLIDDMLRASNKVACEEDYEIEYHCTEKMMEGALKALIDNLPDGGDTIHMEKNILFNLHGNRAELWTELKNLGR